MGGLLCSTNAARVGRPRAQAQAPRFQMTASAERDRPAGDPPGEGGVPLAEAKLSAPRTRSGMIERRRLNRSLDAADGAALTLVAAPPGYGKTTAVRAWCAASNTAFAWV